MISSVTRQLGCRWKAAEEYPGNSDTYSHQNVFWLLCFKQDPKDKLELKENIDSGVYVKDLTTFVVKSAMEIDHVMQVIPSTPHSDRVASLYQIIRTTLISHERGDPNGILVIVKNVELISFDVEDITNLSQGIDFFLFAVQNHCVISILFLASSVINSYSVRG